MLYILYNKLVKTFDRNPGFSVVAFIFFVTQFLTRALQTVCRLSVTRLKNRLRYFKNQTFEERETQVFVSSRPHQFLILSQILKIYVPCVLKSSCLNLTLKTETDNFFETSVIIY